MEEIHVPVRDNSLSIEHTLRPISYTSWFMGVGMARPLKCPKFVTMVIRIIHLVLCTGHLITVIYDLFEFTMNSVIDIAYVTAKTVFYVSAYYYIYHGIRQYDKWPELMDKMKELDRKIRKETHMNDRPVKIMEVVAIFMTFVCWPLLPFVIFLYYFLQSYSDYTYFLYYYMIARSLIYSFVFDVVVYVIYYRYQTMNKLIGHLDKLSDASLIVLKITHIREMHNDIYDLVTIINDFHGLHLLLCLATCFSMITDQLIYAYIYFLYREYALALIHCIVSFVYFMQFGLICWICTFARQEFDKTKIIMCAIALKCQSMKFDKLNDTRNQSSLEVRRPFVVADSEQSFNWSNNHNWDSVVMENLLRKIMDRYHVRNELDDFFTQLQHRQLSFIVCDCFEINNNLFCGFIGVIFTYIIICIQFLYTPI